MLRYVFSNNLLIKSHPKAFSMGNICTSNNMNLTCMQELNEAFVPPEKNTFSLYLPCNFGLVLLGSVQPNYTYLLSFLEPDVRLVRACFILGTRSYPRVFSPASVLDLGNTYAEISWAPPLAKSASCNVISHLFNWASKENKEKKFKIRINNFRF